MKDKIYVIGETASTESANMALRIFETNIIEIDDKYDGVIEIEEVINGCVDFFNDNDYIIVCREFMEYLDRNYLDHLMRNTHDRNFSRFRDDILELTFHYLKFLGHIK